MWLMGLNGTEHMALFFLTLEPSKITKMHTCSLDWEKPSMSLLNYLMENLTDLKEISSVLRWFVWKTWSQSFFCTLETISYALFSDPTSQKITPWMSMSFLYSCSNNTPICSQLQLSPSWSWCSRLLPCSISTTRQCFWLRQSNPKTPRTVQMTGCTGTSFQLGTE